MKGNPSGFWCLSAGQVHGGVAEGHGQDPPPRGSHLLPGGIGTPEDGGAGHARVKAPRHGVPLCGGQVWDPGKG